MLERAPHAWGHTSCSDHLPSDGRASVYAGSSFHGMLASALALCARVACALAETHRDTHSAQRAAATK